MNDIKIHSTLIHRSIVQASLRTLAQSSKKWAALAENSEYAAGYIAGYQDAISHAAGVIEVDAGTSADKSPVMING